MARLWIGLVVLLSLGLIGFVVHRDAVRTAGVAGVWVEDPDAPETRAAREKARSEAVDRVRALGFRDLEAGRVREPASLRPLSLLVLLENGEAGIRPVPPHPSLAATGTWAGDAGGLKITMTHYVGQVVQDPVVSVGRVEKGRLHVRSTFGGEEERGVFLRTAENVECTCDAGRSGETTWCYEHHHGWVGGYETPCWRCSFSALRDEPCPDCRAYFLAEGRRALRDGRPEQAAVLLARALELGADDGSVRFLLARALSEEVPSTWRLHEGVQGVFGPQGGLVAEVLPDEKVRVRDLVTGEVLRVLDGPVEGMHFDPRGRYVVTVTESGTRLQHLRGEASDVDLPGESVPREFVALGPNGDRIACAGVEGGVTVWNRDGQTIASYPEHDAPVSFDASGDRLVLWGPRGALEVLALGRDEPSAEVRVGWFVAGAFLEPAGDRLLLSCEISENWVADLQRQQIVAHFASAGYLESGSGRRARWLPGGRLVVETGTQGTSVHDMVDPECRQEASEPGSPDAFLPIAELVGQRIDVETDFATPDGARFVTTGDDGRGHVLAAVPLGLLATFHAGSERPLFAAFTPDGAYLVTCSREGEVRVWSVGTDDRPAAEIVAEVEAHARWRIEGRDLVPVSPR